MASSVSPADWLDMVRDFLGRCSENGALERYEQAHARLLLTLCPTNLGQVIAAETAPAMLQVTNRVDVAFIFSQPLVKSNADPTPIDTLNFDVERQHILGMLRTHITKEIRFRVYSGNFNSLVSCMSDRVSVLFFSGHISETNHSLCFEDGIGGCVFVYPHQLKNYFPSQQNKDSHSLRLVVLMSCFSENAGRAFINSANVEFVVCIRKDATVSDSVATQFSTAFCTALFKGGFEVRHCFETAKQIVASISPDEAKKIPLVGTSIGRPPIQSNSNVLCGCQQWWCERFDAGASISGHGCHFQQVFCGQKSGHVHHFAPTDTNSCGYHSWACCHGQNHVGPCDWPSHCGSHVVRAQ